MMNLLSFPSILSDEIRQFQALLFGQPVFFLAVGNYLHQENHVSGKRPHLLHAFCIA
jgi:hypothetical protein